MRLLQGHSRDVRAVAYASDGRVISGGGDRTVRVWDPATGTCLRTLKAPNVVYALAVSLDGKTVAAAGRPRRPRSGSNAVTLWNLDGGTPTREYVWELPDPAPSIWSLAFSADGTYLAAACRVLGAANILNGGGGHWWRLREPYTEADFPHAKVYAVGFAPVGAAVALTPEQEVVVLDHPGGPERVRYRLESSWAAAVAFVPLQGPLAIAAGSSLYFVDADARRPRRVKTGIRTITTLAAAPDGRTVLVGGSPGSVESYDAASATRESAFDFGVGRVHGVAFAPDGCTFAVAGEKGLAVCDVG